MLKFKIGDRVLCRLGAGNRQEAATIVATRHERCSGYGAYMVKFDSETEDSQWSVPEARISPLTADLDNKQNTAKDILKEASDCLVNRATERDKEDGERSMKSCVTAFNALTGKSLTETEGWVFMTVLKLARSQGGSFELDDYVDMAAYAALAGESGSK